MLLEGKLPCIGHIDYRIAAVAALVAAFVVVWPTFSWRKERRCRHLDSWLRARLLPAEARIKNDCELLIGG